MSLMLLSFGKLSYLKTHQGFEEAKKFPKYQGFLWESHKKKRLLYTKPFLAYMGQKWLHWDYTSLKILSQFTYNYSKKRNTLEISKDTKIPLRTVSRKLKWFAENNFIKCMTEGKNKKYFLDLYNPLTYHLLINLESFKALEFIKNNQKIALYLKTLDEKIMIFGSFAKYGQGNDLDIVIFNNKEIELAPLDIHPQNISIKEFKKLLMTKNSFAKEIADNHILFNNFDEFIKILIEAYNE